MLTKCPSCSTTFRVTPAQLKARNGKVRCGQCSHVFNALDTLDDDTIPAVAPVASEAQQAVTAQASGQPGPLESNDTGTDIIDIGEAEPVIDTSTATELADAPSAIADTIDESAIETTATAVASDVPDAPDLPDTKVAAPEPEPDAELMAAPAAAPATSSNDLTDYLAGAQLQEPAGPMRRWPWIIGSVFAVVVLLLQGVYYYRVEIAVLQPDLRPLLQAACKPLHCDVPRPRSIETLSIESSDLRPDPLQAGHLTLSATLRSKAVYAQEWPTLELTMTDVADRKLAVKNFAATDYLPKDTNDTAEKSDRKIKATIAAGFPANGQIDVNLPLDVGDLPAAGYRLYIFYP